MTLSQSTVFILTILFMAFPLRGASEKPFRIFTNSAGKQIEAQVVRIVGESNVRVRRKADGKEFEFPITSLSLEDQKYLAAFNLSRKNQSHSSLSIRKDSPNDFLGALSIVNSHGMTTVNASEAVLVLPDSSWVRYMSAQLNRTFLIPYFGEKEWKIEADEFNRLWISRDKGELELVGLSLPKSDDNASYFKRWIQNTDFSKVKHTLSVGADSEAQLEALSALPSEIRVAYSNTSTLDEGEIKTLSRLNLVALDCSVSQADLPRIAACRKLKVLGIRMTDRPATFPVEIPKIEGLEHLAYAPSAGLVRWSDCLAQFPKLRSLFVGNVTYATQTSARSNRERKTAESPIRSLVGNPELEYFVVRGSVVKLVDDKILQTAPNLQVVSIDKDAFISGSSSYGGIEKLSQLRSLYLPGEVAGEPLLADSFEAGTFSNLVEFAGNYVPDFADCPKLEILSVRGNGASRLDYSKLATAGDTLQFLSLSKLNTEELGTLRFAGDSLRALNISYTSIGDAEFFYQFKNLERLSISRNPGALEELDLAKLPSLSTLSLLLGDKIERLLNVSRHQKLQYLSLAGCENFTSFGDAHPNLSLITLSLSVLPKLENLDQLAGLQSLERVTINNCPKLEQIEAIELIDSVNYLYVRKCHLLGDIDRR